LVLSNDTGPGHLAGALSIPTITPFLPGGVYSKEVWASSLWHHGVTLEPSPFTTQEIESAVICDDTAVIDRVPPESIVAEALACLMADIETG
jgi:ADP-heptose:LPS heptosyltransferase